jgi:hypothetical protein
VKNKTLSERVSALDRLLTSQLQGQDEKVQLALSAAEKAITKAEEATEKRFDSVNEFRQTLSDQAATFATKEKLDLSVDTMNTRMDGLERAVTRMLIALLTSIVTVLIGALVIVATR